MKKLIWWSAWSTYEEEFHDQLNSMGVVSEQAVKDLLWYPADHWCRAYFDTVRKNFSVENNFTESFNKWILEARNKPIIKMLEDIRIKVMTRLKDLEDEARTWTGDFSPYAMDFYNDFRIIAQGCQVQGNGVLGYEVVEGSDKHVVDLLRKKCTCRTWDLIGIPCPHVIKVLLHDKQEPLNEMHWWYSKEAYMLVYMHKIQPVRGDKFWKVDPSHAMEPPQIRQMVGRPKIKIAREKNEARMREGLWKNSRKGLKMTCGHCGATDHNKRRCPLLQRGAQTVQDVPLSAPQASQDSEISFMPNSGFNASSGQHNSQPISEGLGPLKSKRKSKAKATSTSNNTPLRALVDEDDDAEIDDEDEQPILRPKVISEAKTRLQCKKMHQPPTGSRKIGFMGDENGVSRPTNLPYSPRKLGWRGEPCVTSNQLEVAKENKIGKLKAKRGKH
ncbi:uncharacterized protein LOC132624670 [Lycium barbarum]|uniref:uncharacterized protein LOC132624670 n=1 Tax=Lycium barbarum TaxID=112863 RepID=UPI00293E94CC|nr:uncharacterized protein LOC132624670 [Lycium barbarum]